MDKQLKSLLAAHSSEITDSAGLQYRGITLEGVARVAGATGVAKREVEIAAIREGITPTRYYKNIGALGADGQTALLSSRVAVVGAGGLGGTLIELLARLGVGYLRVIDGGRFTEDNLNRQLLCREEDIGKIKVEAARDRIKAINSSVEVDPRDVILAEENAGELLKECGVVADALDRIETRIILEKAAASLNIPLVHGAIGGFLGEVTTVRAGGNVLSSLYGPETDGTRSGAESVLGTPTPTPTVVASLQAMEVLKLLLGRGALFSDKLLYIELENGQFSEIKIGSGE